MNIKTILSLNIIVFILLMMSCVSSLPKSQLDFGIEAAQNGLWEESIFRWEKVLQSDPNSAAAHNNLAVAYEKKGNFEKAEIEYKKALQLSPKNEQIQYNYEQFKKNIGKSEKEEEINEKK
ncbi:MAG: tetratricopeptide repeat protein [Acidobacteriota bacterium]